MSLSSTARKNISWNGISFQIPKQWIPTTIEKNYLFFEHDGLPAFEIKWQRGQKKSVVAKTIKQLRANNSSLDFDRPAPLQNSAYEQIAFSWQTDNAQGAGAVLYCETCRTVTLLQSFDEEKSAVSSILSTLVDHSEDQATLWSILDIQFEVPRDFCLQQFAFKPGHYHLSLTHGATTLIFQRWGPADLALKNGGLQAFASKALGSSFDDLQKTTVNGFCGYSYTCEEIALKRKAMDFFRKKKSTATKALWHDMSKNRLLSVKLISQNHQTEWFKKLCSSYVIVRN